MTLIDSLEDPRLADYRSLKTTNHTRWSGRLVAEGRLVVERLIASGLEIHSFLIVEDEWETLAPLLPAGVPKYVVSKAVGRKLVGFEFHQGVLASAARPVAPTLEAVLNAAPERVTLAVCARVTDPVNLATIVRLATAFGASAVLLDQGCADPFSRRVVRVSMGNVFRLPILERADLREELARRRTPYQLSLFATVLSDRAESLDQVQPSGRNVLVFGNEAQGLSADWLTLCDRQVTIPMRGGTDSLNVAVAAGIFLHHFDPQRA